MVLACADELAPAAPVGKNELDFAAARMSATTSFGDRDITSSNAFDTLNTVAQRVKPV